MSENINVFGLQSFIDPNEAWKIMSCDFGSYEIDLQILNDKTFVKAVLKPTSCVPPSGVGILLT